MPWFKITYFINSFISDAQQLENFAIYIYFVSVFDEPESIFVQRCASFVGQPTVKPSATVSLKCQSVINARFLIITKFPNASFPGLLTIAELTIHDDR